MGGGSAVNGATLSSLTKYNTFILNVLKILQKHKVMLLCLRRSSVFRS